MHLSRAESCYLVERRSIKRQSKSGCCQGFVRLRPSLQLRSLGQRPGVDSHQSGNFSGSRRGASLQFVKKHVFLSRVFFVPLMFGLVRLHRRVFGCFRFPDPPAPTPPPPPRHLRTTDSLGTRAACGPTSQLTQALQGPNVRLKPEALSHLELSQRDQVDCRSAGPPKS